MLQNNFYLDNNYLVKITAHEARLDVVPVTKSHKRIVIIKSVVKQTFSITIEKAQIIISFILSDKIKNFINPQATADNPQYNMHKFLPHNLTSCLSRFSNWVCEHHQN